MILERVISRRLRSYVLVAKDAMLWEDRKMTVSYIGKLCKELKQIRMWLLLS